MLQSQLSMHVAEVSAPTPATRTAKVMKYGVMLVKEGNCSYEKINGPEGIYCIAESLGLADKAEEEFWIICLDTKNKPIGLHMVSRGSLNSSMVHPREVFKRAIANNSCSIILMHNHPSGNPEPSGADIDVTRRLVEAGELIGIKVLDHIIVGDTCQSLKSQMQM